MNFVLIALLLLSFGNSPFIVLAADNSHSVAFINEHGVDHLVFFHRAGDSENESHAYFAPVESNEHHEVHLSSSTGLIQKRLQISNFTSPISATSDPLESPKTIRIYSLSTFEPNVGQIHPPLFVLRI